jgi:amidase
MSLDGLGLAAAIRSGELSSSEAVEASIEKIEAENPRINAVVHKMYDDARARAKSPPAGPFQGVPLLVKDLLCAVAGQPLACGSRALRDYVPQYDAELIVRLRKAGFILVGKTNTPEFGILGTTEPELFGPTRNPWNTQHSAGGSSGGAAAAVAAGWVPIAQGGDGGGSIRIPASACGLFGLKPTRGRTPFGPVQGEGWAGFAQEHVITRSVRDSAAVLDAIHGLDDGAPYAAPAPERPFLDEVSREPGKLRIAFSTGSLFGKTVHPEVAAAVADTAKLLASLGHEVVEDTPSFSRDELVRAYLVVVATSAAGEVAGTEALTGRKPTSDQFESTTWLLHQIGGRLSATDYQSAVAAAHRAGRSVAGFFQKYDVFLNATLAWPPPKIGEWAPTPSERRLLGVLRAFPVRAALFRALDDLAEKGFEKTANTQLFNQTGQPAMSVPLGWTRDGLPIGSQFAARFGDEATLLRLAAQLEQARPWAARTPPR